MIIAVIGPQTSDIDEFITQIDSRNKIQHVDLNSLIQSMTDKTLKNKLLSTDATKKWLLHSLNAKMGNLIVTGNVVLNVETCKWLLDCNHQVIVVKREKLEDYDFQDIHAEYWGDEVVLRYELETKFNSIYSELYKHNHQVKQVNMMNSSAEVENISTLLETVETTKRMTKADLLLLNSKGDDNMTIRDSIMSALKRIDDSQSEIENNSTKTTREPEHRPNPTITSAHTIEIAPKTPKLEENKESKVNSIKELYAKISDGAMALLIPDEIELDKRVVGNTTYKVVTVNCKDLDLSSNTIQTLKVIQPENTLDKSTKISKEQKGVSQPTSLSANQSSSDLDELKSEKAKLDSEIKTARASGDIDLVNSLRKARRAIRNKINKLK